MIKPQDFVIKPQDFESAHPVCFRYEHMVFAQDQADNNAWKFRVHFVMGLGNEPVLLLIPLECERLEKVRPPADNVTQR